jgi:hypothetical protein
MREEVKARGPPGMRQEFRRVPVIPTNEASRSNNVSKVRAGESVIRRTGTVRYAVKLSMHMRDCHSDG